MKPIYSFRKQVKRFCSKQNHCFGVFIDFCFYTFFYAFVPMNEAMIWSLHNQTELPNSVPFLCRNISSQRKDKSWFFTGARHTDQLWINWVQKIKFVSTLRANRGPFWIISAFHLPRRMDQVVSFGNPRTFPTRAEKNKHLIGHVTKKILTAALFSICVFLIVSVSSIYLYFYTI